MNIIADESKLKSDAGAILVIEKIKSFNLDDNALIYYNFPFYRGETLEELIQAHILYLSKVYGIIAFRTVASASYLDAKIIKQIDELDSHLFSKINKVEELRKGRRDLKINITPIVVVCDNSQKEEEVVTIKLNEIKETIEKNKAQELTDKEFNILVATIEGTKRSKQKKDRDISDEKLTKGKILSLIQQQETVFDLEQKRAALNTIDSPQRIRGLAGSGKTIILTMKAALYHLQNPDSLILYTYFTKSLYGQIKYLIEKFYRDFSENQEPDWSRIHILHGWGGVSLKGVYSEACFDNDISPMSFPEAKRNNSANPFGYACMTLLKYNIKQKYDLSLIDEGQDFPLHFYQLCYALTKNRRIVWAYDDFQNIFDTKIQDEKETFGKSADGTYLVDFSRNENQLQDIVLHKCYRNPKRALVAAFSLGLGIYNTKVLQRLENNQHWIDLGFAVEEGDSSDGIKMVISRLDENSPMDTNNYFGNNTIKFKKFNDIDDECAAVAKDIIKQIRIEKLKPDDICVISLDEKHINNYFQRIEKHLQRNDIKVFNMLSAPNNNIYFSIENHVTLSSINKAKGNEVGMVYIVGVDAAFTENNIDYIIYRNKIFTAITRTKGWVVITGMGDCFDLFEKEIRQLEENNYKFIFKQPSKDSTNTIFRRMDERQSLINQINKKISDLIRTGLQTDDVLKMIDLNQKK